MRRAFLWPLGMMGAFALLLSWLVAYLFKVADRVDHTDQLLAQVHVCERLAVDLETGMRGYQVTGDKQFLNPFTLARSAIGKELTKLEQLSARDSFPITQVQDLLTNVESWETIAQELIRRREQNVNEPATALNLQGKAAMDELRRKFGDFRHAIESLRQNRVEGVERMKSQVLSTRWIIAIVLGVGIGWYVRRQMLEVASTYNQALATAAQETESAKKSQHDLRQERERYQVTLASIGDAVIAADTRGAVTFLNPVAEALTGWISREAIGQPIENIFRVVNEKTRQPAENPAQVALRRGTIVVLANHTALISKAGFETSIEDSAAPIRDERGSVVGAVMVFRDVTERRREHQALACSEALKNGILESALDCIVTMDHEGKVIEFNPAATKTFGYSRHQALGQFMADLIIPPALREQHRKGFARHLATGEGHVIGQRLELTAMRADGSEFPVELAISRVTLEGPPIFTAYLRDITERKRAHATSAHLAAVVESSGYPIISKTLDGIITAWNNAAQEMFGYTANEIIGQSILRLIPPERAAEEEQILSRVRSGERIVNFETVRQTKSGRLLPVSLCTSPIKNSDGKLLGASKIILDISERKKAEELARESEARYRRLFEFSQAITANMAEGLYTVDLNGCVTYINPAAEGLFGWSTAELQGRKMHDITHYKHSDGTPFPASECAGLRVLQTGIPLRNHEDVFIRKDGSFFPVIFSASRLTADGQTVGIVVAFRDDTQRRRTEQELHQTLQDLKEAKQALTCHAVALEQEVSVRTAELREANSQLESFIYSIAHDLRHPLRAMQGFSEILLESHAETLDETGRKYLQRINNSAQRMDNLLLDLLDYARTARATIDTQQVPLQRAWETALSQCSQTVEEMRAQVETVDPLPVVRAHETTLSQMLINLLSNALKFVPPGVAPHVRFKARVQGDVVRVCMEDNGIGIAPEYHERIFRVFERLGGTQYEGTGIGLAIVRKGAERMGGRVGVESEAGKGSRFWVELPKA